MTRRLGSAAVFVLALTVLACAPPRDDDAAPATDSDGESGVEGTGEATSIASSDGADGSTGAPLPPTGAGLYASLCAACHGADALGTPLGYELRHPVREYAAWVVRNGRAGTELAPSVMVPFTPEQLDDDELELVFDYLDAFPRARGGQALYEDHCRNCHGVDARGGEAGKDISDKGLHDLDERVREGTGGAAYGNRLVYMPQADAEVLTDAELQLVADYIATL